MSHAVSLFPQSKETERPSRGYPTLDPEGRLLASGNLYKSLTIARSEASGLFRMQPREDERSGHPSAIVLALHGVGAEYSHMGSLSKLLHVLNAPKSEKKSGTIYQTQNALVDASGVSLHAHVAAYAYDLPYCGSNQAHGVAPDLAAFCESMRLEIESFASMRLPIFLFARSASGSLAIEIARRNKIAGLILMNPTHVRDDVVQHGVGQLQAMGAEGLIQVNEGSLRWMLDRYDEMNWHRDPRPLGETPTLVLISQHDREMPSFAQEAWKRDAELGEQNHVVLFGSEQHDLFADKDHALDAWLQLYSFLQTQRRRNWSNDENIAFYDKMPNGLLDQVALKKGLGNCEDLQTLWPELRDTPMGGAPRILEIGAGTGRVVAWLRERLPQAEVVALEHSRTSCAHLERRFQGDSKVRIDPRNVLDLQSDERFSLALWMWSSFTELHPGERLHALQLLHRALHAGGALAIDVPAEIKGHGVVLEHAGGFNEVLEPYGTLRTHSPKRGEVQEMALEAGFTRVDEIYYETATDILRCMFILRR